MTDLTAQILAAINKAEAEMDLEWYDRPHMPGCQAFLDIPVCDCTMRGDVLRRCAADRRMVGRHFPEQRSGYRPDDDDTPGAYGRIKQACAECGSSDQAVRWPCPTLRDLAEGYGITVGERP